MHLAVLSRFAHFVSNAVTLLNSPQAMETHMSAKFLVATALTCFIACGPTASAAESTGHFARDLSAEVVGSPALGASATGAKLSVTSMAGPVVEEGQRVRFKIASNRSGFVHLYVLSASGRLQLWMENVPIAASRPLIFPTTTDVTIKAEAPGGRDRIVALLTRKRLDGFNGQMTTETPMDLDMGREEFQNAVEGMLTENEKNDLTWASTAVRVD